MTRTLTITITCADDRLLEYEKPTSIRVAVAFDPPVGAENSVVECLAGSIDAFLLRAVGPHETTIVAPAEPVVVGDLNED